MAKPAFPQTPEGVTDWEKVFEDPEGGLIPVIAAAHTPDALRNCLVVVIKRLFTRQSDELEVARLMNQIEALFEDSDEPVPTDTAMALLRQIKDHRIEKARKHLAKKAQKRRDRRSGSGKKRFERALYKLFKDPRYLLGMVAVMLLVLGMIIADVSGLLNVDELLAPDKSAKDEGPATSAPAKTADIPREAPPLDLRKPEEEEKFPPTVVLRRVTPPRSFSSQRSAPPPILPILVLREKDDASAVCGDLPYIFSMINVALSDALARKIEFNDAGLAEIGRSLTQKLNAKLGANKVNRIILAVPPDARFLPPRSCGPSSEKAQQYLKQWVQPGT